MNILVKDKQQQDILRSQMAEAFDFVTERERMSIQDYNTELFENGTAFANECQAPEMIKKKEFWDWFTYRYHLHDLEYMLIAPSQREPYKIWKLGIVTNENIKRDFFIYANKYIL